MKNWQKICCVLALTCAMSLGVAAEDAQTVPEEIAVSTENVTLPTFVKAEQIRITSSLASDGTSLSDLYDLYADTAVTFADAGEGVSLSMTTEEAFRLHAIVVNEVETKYEAKLYASTDGENWKEVLFDTKTVDGFVVYQTRALGRDYKFYRLEATTDDGEALTFHTLAMYEKQEDVWPFSLYHMYRSSMAQH